MNTELVTLKTTMTCASCIEKVRPALESAGISKNLRFDIESPDKTVQFDGTGSQRDQAIAVLNDLGYDAQPLQKLSSAISTLPNEVNFFETYNPLILVGIFLVGITGLVELKMGSFNLLRATNVFMGGFFIFFSFFKLLGLAGFADAFSTYDLIAKKSRAYALAYPFIELALGIGFILEILPKTVNVITIFLMVIGNFGVWSVLRKKQTIQCACLGTIFKLPMTKVTLFENTLMFLMAVAALTFN